MTCVMCSRAVTSAVSKMPGVYSVHVNLVSETADVLYNPKMITTDDIGDRINLIGYEYLGIHDNNSINNEILEKKHAENQKNKLYRIIVGFFFSALLMYLMFGNVNLGHNSSYILLAISILPFIYVSYPIIKSGITSIRHLNLNMDVMYSLGIGISFIVSVLSTFHLLGESHFMLYDTSIMLGSFLMLGKYLEDRAKGKTSDSIKKLVQLKSTEATVEKMVDGQLIQKKVPINEVFKGNVVIVKPGEKIPLDGEIIEGQSYVDESLVTGESMPVLKKVSSNVIGGSINKEGSFKFKVTNTNEKTVLSQIISMVQDAQNSNPPIQKLADKVIKFFIPTILIIALIAFAVWYFYLGSPFLYSLSIFISVIVVACPCSLGLAIPTALTVGVGLASKYGILIKDGETLEVSDKINHVLLDKTGTVTNGKPILSEIINYSNKNNEEILKIARSIEQYSQHPISSAIFNDENKNNYDLYPVTNFENISGKGVKANINNKTYLIGNKKLIEDNDINIPKNIIDDLEQKEFDLKTGILLAEKEVLAIITIEDTIKENSVKAINALHKMGIETSLVSGDNKNTSEKVAQKVGINDVISEVLPQGKLDYVKKIQSLNKIVAFIGDGINDAPSLTKADVGIAMGTGTDVAIESGDMILVNGDLLNAVAGIQISKKTMSRVKLNLFWAFAYNVILIPIAAGILIPWGIFFRPEYSAFAMALSSVTVITLSLLLKRYVPEIFKDE
ncbi:MAG: heavy metal translocating P-type ATPase [Methanosphaera sp.]|uniref:heavy metal translocating P-type ATPase n=1 Tax=Methanosphaera sp. TaxID=2666342 RepID=UPI002E75AD30|nr:heavy metal translocating P-type ATPase [Methanosphaera sp.]MEE1117814.1 heavy metal translocating P-type ATPase [Methanosphaera sp.]MEE3418880.1 heavy metal translocating P-type ATPase [Methanosphaera sp.]